MMTTYQHEPHLLLKTEQNLVCISNLLPVIHVEKSVGRIMFTTVESSQPAAL